MLGKTCVAIRKLGTTLSFLSLPWFVLGAIWFLPGKQNPPKGQGDEVATKIESGVMTERQKEHSKIYDQFYTRDHGRLDIDPQSQRVRDFEANMYKPSGLEPQVEPSSFEEFMKRRPCAADAVVAGEVISKESQLVASAQFLFTEYTVRVVEVYKNNQRSAILPGSDITVVRPGGKVEIRGRIVKTVDGRFLPLTVGGGVLLFLKYIPATGSYDSAPDRGSFAIDNGMLTPLTDQVVSGFDSNKSVEFTANIRSAIAASCSN